jgi:MFS transporter, DHA2 family, multidrug resistance protein
MNSEEVQQEWTPSINPWLIAISVILAAFMDVLDTSIANVALPHMSGTFSVTSQEALWILTSYLIANGIILPCAAWFSGLFGRKNFFIICISIFIIASIACGFANSLEMMIFWRVIQGLGGGALVPTAQAVLWESFPKEKRGVSMAAFGFCIVLAPVIGPTLGGWITDNYSWNWIFFINVPIGILAIILSKMFIEEPPYSRRGEIQKIDYVGFLTLVTWLVTLQVVLDNGQTADWFNSTWVCWTSFVSVCAMIFFFFWEFHFTDSIIDLTIFKNKNYAIGTLFNMFITAILYSTLAILPSFLQNLLGYSALNSGLAITPRGIACIFAIILVGYLSGKLDNRIQIVIGLSLLSVSCFIFGNINLNIGIKNIIFPNVICGFALGFCFIPISTLSYSTLKNYQLANATGLQNLLKNLGGAIGTSIVATMLSRNAQVHQAYMVSHLSPSNNVFQEKFAALNHFFAMNTESAVVASQKANALIYSTLVKQSVLWSYIDSFRLFGILSLILIPAVFILKDVKVGKSSNNASSLH